MKAIKTFLIMGTVALAITGCSRKVYVPVESVSTDTLRIVSHDSVKVTKRLAPVSIVLPQYHGERATRDSTSVLENGLYRSTASLHGGMLTHTLESLPGAKVEGLATVHDTIRIFVKDKEHKRYNGEPKVAYRPKELTWLEKGAAWTGYVVWGVIAVILVYLGIRWKLR